MFANYAEQDDNGDDQIEHIINSDEEEYYDVNNNSKVYQIQQKLQGLKYQLNLEQHTHNAVSESESIQKLSQCRQAIVRQVSTSRGDQVPNRVGQQKFYRKSNIIQQRKGPGRPPGSKNIKGRSNDRRQQQKQQQQLYRLQNVGEQDVLNQYFELGKKREANQLYQHRPLNHAQYNEDGSKSRSRSMSKSQGVFQRKQKFPAATLSTRRFAGTEREFIYEVPYQLMKRTGRGKRIGKPGYKVDDTRSLYDDPRFQRIRMNNQKQVVAAISGQLNSMEDLRWSPIHETERVPKNFYMPEQFKERGGVRNIDYSTIKNEYDAFNLFFDEEVQKYILSQTHAHYHKEFKKSVYFYCTEQKSERPKYENYFNSSDLLGYIAIYLYFGIVKMRNTRDYWSMRNNTRANRDEDADLIKFLDAKLRSTRQSSQIRKQSRTCINQDMIRIMSYAKYKHLRNCLRFGPTGEKGNPDSIYKIRDLITLLNKKFSHYYQPGEFICIDEGMIPFNGRVKFKIYNPQKPTKWGIKEYVLSDAVVPYTLIIKLHDGIENEDEENEQNEILKGKISNLVLAMTQDYQYKSHKLVMDNYYNSPGLFQILKSRGIGAIGTLRHNRTGLQQSQIRNEYFNKIFQNERIFYISADHQLLLLYFLSCANHPVAFLSSFVPHNQTSSALDLHSLQLRPRKDEIPSVLTFYNKYKGGVDRRNAFCAFMRRKGELDSKWWRSVFWRLVETCVINSFVVYKQIHPEAYKHRTFQDFRVSLIIILASKYRENENKLQIPDEYTWVKKFIWFKRDGHTMMKGMTKGQCVQCKTEITQNFCQDCSIDANKTIHVCTKTYCNRFHKFCDFDMNIELFERNYKTKKNKMQERKITFRQKNMKHLQDATKQLEKEKLELMVKKNQQVEYINTLMQRIQHTQNSETTKTKINSYQQDSVTNDNQFEQMIQQSNQLTQYDANINYDQNYTNYIDINNNNKNNNNNNNNIKNNNNNNNNNNNYDNNNNNLYLQEEDANDDLHQQQLKLEILVDKYTQKFKEMKYEQEGINQMENNDSNPYDLEINMAKINQNDDESSSQEQQKQQSQQQDYQSSD